MRSIIVHRRPRSCAVWLVALVVGLLGLSGWSQTPIDLLQSLDPSIGRLMWKAALGYSASGREGLGFDELGDPYSYTILEQDLLFSFSATTGLSATTSMGATTALRRTDTTESRRYADLQTQGMLTNRAASCLVWQQFRLDAAAEADPRLTVSVGYPVAAGLSLSTAIVRDPMVLAAEAGFRGGRTLPAAWLVLDLGAGFVANRWIQVTVCAGLEVPVDVAGLPTARLGGEVRYTLNANAGTEVAVRASMVTHGERSSLLVELEVAGG